MKRRTAITAVPLGILGLTAIARGNVATTTNGVLDERSLSYALELVIDASHSGIGSAFTAFAQHIAELAAAGDCKQIRAVFERLIDRLYAEHNHYNETREKWLSESRGDFCEVVDMDDQDLPESLRERASDAADARHLRRNGGEW